MSAQPQRHQTPANTNTGPELSPDTAADREGLVFRIGELGPWHMDIQLTGDLSTGQAVAEANSQTIKPLNLRDNFLERLGQIFPNGLDESRMLDCACNAGGYCFWAAEKNVKSAFGFDGREQWIRQARFVKTQRTITSNERLRFEVGSFDDLAAWKLQTFNLTLFKGIFAHLADPVSVLRKVADLSSDVIILNTPYIVGEPDGNMKFLREDQTPMAGMDGAKWMPTGPMAVSDILKWLGFATRKLIYCRESNAERKIGRMEIVAARNADSLAGLPHESI